MKEGMDGCENVKEEKCGSWGGRGEAQMTRKSWYYKKRYYIVEINWLIN